MRPVAGCLVLLAASLAVLPVAAGQDPAFPPGVRGQFVALDLRSGKAFRVDPAGCRRRYPPYSSFKIPNSLIGLETEVVKDAGEVWRWDAATYPPPDAAADYVRAWSRDLDLRTALSQSIVWWYRELALRVGAPRMKRWLARFDYGNQDISGGLDRFWLGSSLRISPDEQAAFLSRLQRGRLPVRRSHLRIVQQILTQDSTATYRLVAKSGSSGSGEGWLVGWILRPDGGCAFALHLEAQSHAAMVAARLPLARALLARAGYLPARSVAGAP